MTMHEYWDIYRAKYIEANGGDARPPITQGAVDEFAKVVEDAERRKLKLIKGSL